MAIGSIPITRWPRGTCLPSPVTDDFEDQPYSGIPIQRQLTLAVALCASVSAGFLLCLGIFLGLTRDSFELCRDVNDDARYLTCLEETDNKNWVQRHPGVWVGAGASLGVAALTWVLASRTATRGS